MPNTVTVAGLIDDWKMIRAKEIVEVRFCARARAAWQRARRSRALPGRAAGWPHPRVSAASLTILAGATHHNRQKTHLPHTHPQLCLGV